MAIQTKTFREALIDVECHIHEALHIAKKEIDYAELADVPHWHKDKDAVETCDNKDECGGLHPYLRLIEVCEEGINRARFLIGHQHEWTADGFCMHCGANGAV